MWELSSPTRDGTRACALAVQSLNHWFAREVPLGVFSRTAHWFMVKVRAVALSCDFTVLDVFAGVPLYACGVTGPTDWSFRCIKTLNSTCVDAATVVLSVSNLRYCLTVPFSLSLSPAACEAYIGDRTSFVQFCILQSTTFEMWPQSLSV